MKLLRKYVAQALLPAVSRLVSTLVPSCDGASKASAGLMVGRTPGSWGPLWGRTPSSRSRNNGIGI